MFIAGSHLLQLPLLLSRDLLYALACAATVLAMSPMIASPWRRLALFAALLFNPISFAMDRILREQIYFALALLVVACAFAIWLRPGWPARRLLPWSAGLGLALGAFWLTREEGVWILPVLVFLYAAGAWQYARERGSWRKYSAVYGVPLLLWGACLLAVAELNSAYYKTFSTVETKQADFVAAYGALSRIREGAWLPTTPVSTAARLQAYRYSPAFAELRPYLEGEMSRPFAYAGNGGWTDLFTGPAYHPLLRNQFSDYFGVQFPQSGAEAWAFCARGTATTGIRGPAGNRFRWKNTHR
ncbi:MAG: hypothetical protein WDN04_21400 [Rhodospirillales bacterium]